MTPTKAAGGSPPAASSPNFFSYVGVEEACRNETPDTYQALCDFLRSPCTYLPMSCYKMVHTIPSRLHVLDPM
jgi:hypothetical protein